MNMYPAIAQIIIALSIIYVWVFRFENIEKEFKQYGLSDLTRTAVGAVKISLATLLIVAIWYPSLLFYPSLLMAMLMVSAQYFHFKVNNPLQKHIPSLFLLILCLYIVSASMSTL